jgi:glycerophosphoryl diester phosphodiesterase
VAQISAHRGGSETTPPASYAAYESALASGAEYAEFDIRKTADGVLVVRHDEVVQPGGPLITAVTYRQLCDQLGFEVPQAGRVMELLAGRLAGHLDLKEAGYEPEVVSLALDTFGPDGFVVTTALDASLARIRRDYPGVRTALSLGQNLAGLPPWRQAAIRRSELRPLPRIQACGASWVASHYRLARLGVLRQCARRGIGVMIWTVDGDRLIDRFLADPRVTVLITNRPAAAVARRQTRPGALAG